MGDHDDENPLPFKPKIAGDPDKPEDTLSAWLSEDNIAKVDDLIEAYGLDNFSTADARSFVLAIAVSDLFDAKVANMNDAAPDIA